MNNTQIGARIQRLAAMMSLLDENTFKIRSFEKAAHIVQDHAEEMGSLVDEDRLKNLPGIGPVLANLIMHFAKSGTAGLEKDLESELPPGLPDLLDLPGLGVKKVQQLWKEHGITSLEQLDLACQNDELSQVKGFGPRLQQKLLEAIAFKAKHAQDYYLDLALSVAGDWLEKLNDLPSTGRVELTGTLRRGNELIRSVDFLIEADEKALLSDMGENFGHIIHTSDHLIFKDRSGMPILLRTCGPEAFAAQQLVHTGGEAFVSQLKARYGSTPDAMLAGLLQTGVSPDEQVLCDAIGIQWLEPELRDSYTQFDEKAELVSQDMIKGTLHAHSTWSDGRNTLEEMVSAARKCGYQYLGISEHSQAAYYANGLNADRVKAQWDRIDELNEVYSDFHIFKGIEADILADGQLDYTEELLAGFDFVIASIHSHFHLDPVRQTERIVRALQSPFTTLLGHPTGRMLMARPGYDPDLKTIIDAAVENDKLIEINTTPKRLDLDWRHLKYAREKGLRISINPDAHSTQGLQTIPLGVRIARKGGYSADAVLNTMGVDDLKDYLLARRKT